MTGSRGRPPTGARVSIGAAVLMAAAVFVACESSDVVPPAGSTVQMSANPATLVFTGGTNIPQTIISARVANALGVSLPGQTVFFDTTEGLMTPAALTPILTDSSGIATVTLETVRTATVNASSGSASDSTTITVLQGNLQSILLNGQNTLTNCNIIYNYTAQAVDTSNNPVPGVTITFELRDENGLQGSAPGFAGSFTPTQGVTNANGELDTQLIPDVADCTLNCSAPNDCDATTSIVAVDSTGLFESVPLVLLDAVP